MQKDVDGRDRWVYSVYISVVRETKQWHGIMASGRRGVGGATVLDTICVTVLHSHQNKRLHMLPVTRRVSAAIVP